MDFHPVEAGALGMRRRLRKLGDDARDLVRLVGARNRKGPGPLGRRDLALRRDRGGRSRKAPVGKARGICLSSQMEELLKDPTVRGMDRTGDPTPSEDLAIVVNGACAGATDAVRRYVGSFRDDEAR